MERNIVTMAGMMAILWACGGAELSVSRLHSAVIQMQGEELQGEELQGEELQGEELQGVTLNGEELQGLSLQGTVLSGSRGRSRHVVSGSDLIGAILTGTDTAGRTWLVQISDVQQDPSPGNSDVWLYTLLYFDP